MEGNQNHKGVSIDLKPEPKLEERFQRYWNIMKQKMDARKMSEDVIGQIKKVLERSMHDPILDRGLGAMYGAMIGDALGAYCEFHRSLPDEIVNEAMQMNGGGTFGLNAGQFTDDSQLASHLLSGLSRFDENEQLSIQQKRLICNLGIEYIRWYMSRPFDIGNTTRGSIDILFDNQQMLKDYRFRNEKPKELDPMFKAIYERNKNSQANGSLMRISPMAFFLALTGQEPLEHSQLIKDEVRLTHPNERLQAAGLCWVDTLCQLIRRPNNESQTFKKIRDRQLQEKQFKIIETWLKEAGYPKEEAMSGAENMGYAKIAFSYGFRVLEYLAKGLEKRINAEMYHDWMWWIIKRAGDTDTNGAIAGSLMGSVVGFWNLPFKYVITSLMTITDSKAQKIQFKGLDKSPPSPAKSKYHAPSRPQRYEPFSMFVEALKMVEKCERYRNRKEAPKK